MKKIVRNLMLSAAALVAALTVAPKSEAAWRVRVRAPAYRIAPWRFVGYPYRSVGYRVAPFRTFGGFRFYSYCPGPGYVYVSDGWVLPPYAGAIWIGGRYARGGVWIAGHFR